MKIFWIVLLVVVLGVAINSLVMYLLQKRRQQRAERDGVVLYATLVSETPLGGLLKYADMKKLVMRVQDPGTNAPREVSLRTRLPAGQKVTPGMRITVVVDPKDPKRVYPASPEAAKRVVVTGSRLERRHMRVGTAAQQQQQRDNIPFPRHLNNRR
jgi:hypothetical protein